MVSPVYTPLLRLGKQASTRRARLIICLCIYGGGLGVAALLVSFLARTRFPNEAEHMSLVPSLILSSGAALAGAVLAGAIAYWAAQDANRPRSILAWAFLGFGFGVLLPFFTGALIPLCTVFLNLSAGIITAGEVFTQAIDAIFRAPLYAFTHGVFGMFTGMLAGALFAAGAWLIDLTNASARHRHSRYAAYTVSLGLSLAVIAIAAFGPPDVLAKLG